eukprot:CAMPEP_0177172384 /NCGR_PEP_ID=MMETSP0367-20130122/11106_1 /TAXON_ID=447022 ORGANISM="Scrippsiella hangoei-like, Strain SHHI-4" /NCGR_SAMPLE_ID=MMETSP0367 /ASSEMBLY_ACC=CAM_ASM_000362 /LENGTH=59 /DNA_ID=CAMNT_0018618651 /DNA_START=271 /DNA_END=450 /DNA_ORIENTATION=-
MPRPLKGHCSSKGLHNQGCIMEEPDHLHKLSATLGESGCIGRSVLGHIEPLQCRHGCAR